jgi:hypothetical protein
VDLERREINGLTQVICRNVEASAEKAAQILRLFYGSDPVTTMTYEPKLHPPRFDVSQ